MDMPTGEMPQIPGDLRDKMDRVDSLLREIHASLEQLGMDPVDDTWTPPWKKGANAKDVQAIIDALERRRDPLRYSYAGLRIEGIEMTQSTQFYDLYGQGSGAESNNMVPLIAGKDLILRVYVERRKGPLWHEPVQFDGVVRYNGKEVRSLNGPRPVQSAAALRRALLGDSLNFRIPAADCFGTVHFQARVSQVPPSNVFNNTRFNVTATFYEIPRMKVTGVLINFRGNSQNWAAPGGVDLIHTMTRFLPMLPIRGYDYNACQIIDYSGDLTMKSGWDTLLDTVDTLRSASTIRTFFIGLLPANVATMASVSNRGIGRWGVAVASNNDTRALSHEIGHACSLDHVDFNGAPAPFDAKYPNYESFPFGSIGETGIDTARMTLYSPTTSYDFMTYNENGNPPPLFTTSTWISPYNYRKVMQFVRATEGTADIILWVAGVVVAKAMLLNFRVHRGGRVEILPSYPVSGVPVTQDARATRPVMIDLLDREGRVIVSQRCHLHNPYQDPEGPYVDYHEILPWSETVAEIAFFMGREELARERVADRPAPSLRIHGVRRASEDETRERGDLARVEWSAGEEGEAAAAALVRYTPDGGQTWYAVAEIGPNTRGQNEPAARGRCLVNLDLLPGGDDCRFEVIASAGLSAAAAESEPFVVRRKPVRAYIISPQNGQTFRAGQTVEFTGAGHSPDIGLTPDPRILWASSLEGTLGTGSVLARADLRPGTHRITLIVPAEGQDGHGGEATASVWIEIVGAEPGAQQCPPEEQPPDLR